MIQRHQSEITPKNNLTLEVIRVARISTLNQDELSLDDQLVMLKTKVKELYEWKVMYTDLATQGSGERVDRLELIQLEEMIESGKYDMVIAEDLARICRRTRVMEICEMCEDAGTRLIAINDRVDTGEEGWRDGAFISTWHHERSNSDGRNRIIRSLRNRFNNGQILPTPIYGIIKPKGAKHESKLSKDPEAEKVYDEWFTKLEQGASFSEVADWLNELGIPTGPDCRLKKWDSRMVGRVTQNPMLKGDRVRNRMKSKRNNKLGHYRSVKADPEYMLTRHCEHLVFIEPERFDRVNRMLMERNKKYRRGKKNARDPLKDRPKKRTAYPGQSVFCGVCGRLYVYGGNGIKNRLMCSGSRERKCWNGITFSGEDVRNQLVPSVMNAIENLPAFEPEYITQLKKEVSELDEQQSSKHHQLDKKEQILNREIENITSAIKKSGGSSILIDELPKLDEQKHALQLQRDELNRQPVSQIVIPDIEPVKQFAREQFGILTAESPEFARLMKQLIPQFVVFPYRLIDGGHPVLRASVTFTAAPLISLNEDSLPGLSERLTRQWQFDLFVPPQREIYRERVMELTENTKLTEREIAKQLGITQPAVQYAKKLARLMVEQGITEAYQPLLAPPEDFKKMRRHLHKHYQFEPEEGFPLEYPANMNSTSLSTKDSH